MPPAPVEVSINESARGRKAVTDVSGPPEVAPRPSSVETEEMVRRECGEGEKASEQEEVVEIRKEKKDPGATVETIELREEGCREILMRDELRPPQEDDLWSDDDWLTDLMLELKPPEPSSRVSPEKEPSPEVALDKGAEEVRRENENRETEVERDEREPRDEQERSVEREKSE